ncbi:MAG: heavy-metal-associated domain-containing protein [Verrucomicrobia bacterium]|nr:heavy-metal-associated domain-containing protein [Verrucomicrobiota bacterium]
MSKSLIGVLSVCLLLPVLGCQRSADAEPVSAQLSISGMTCEGCANGIEGTVSKMKGVRSIEVDLESETAVVAYVPAKCDLSKITRKINGMGFSATVKAENPTIQ